MIDSTRRCMTLGALGLALASLTARAQGQDTIKIGLLLIDAGPFATYAKLMEQAARTGINILNAEGGALGRKFELVIQLHAGTPAGALAAANKLVEQGGAGVLVGQTFSPHSLALIPKLEQMNVLLIDHYAQSNDLMTKSCSPNYFRVNTPDSVITRMMEDYVRQTGAKSWSLISSDNASGQSFARQFGELVRSMGGTVRQNLFAPVGTSDYGSYISQLSNPADGLVVSLYMSDGQSFAKQQKQFGLFDKYKVVLGNGFATDFQLEAHGDNVLGVVNGLSYSPMLPGARNAQYVKEFEARNKRKPFYVDADLMAALEVYRAGIIKAKSTETAAVRTALEGLKVNTIFGDGEIRAEDHHLVRQSGIAQVVRAPDGKTQLQMKSVKTGQELYPPPSKECKVH